MNQDESQILSSVLDRLERCPVCHHTHNGRELTVVRRDERYWLVQVECSECHRKSFVAAVLDSGSATEARRALRELSAAANEFTPFDADPVPADPTPPAPPVSAGDVLDMHEFLGSFDGDFRRLFRPSGG